MTTNNDEQVSPIRSQARAWGSREGSWTAENLRATLTGVDAEVDAAIAEAVGVDGVEAFWNAPSRVEANRATRGTVVRLAGSPA